MSLTEVIEQTDSEVSPSEFVAAYDRVLVDTLKDFAPENLRYLDFPESASVVEEYLNLNEDELDILNSAGIELLYEEDKLNAIRYEDEIFPLNSPEEVQYVKNVIDTLLYAADDVHLRNKGLPHGYEQLVDRDNVQISTTVQSTKD